jgi:hypothetical protein
MSAPIESKVYAGAGGGAVVSPLILWLLGVLFWGQPADALHAVQAISAVPAPVAVFVTALVAGLAGWLAPHTNRPGELIAVIDDLRDALRRCQDEPPDTAYQVATIDQPRHPGGS